MNLEEIKELMEALVDRGLNKLVYKKGDFELHLEKGSAPVASPSRQVAHETAHQAATPITITQDSVEEKGDFVTSPMVGTYYASSGPDQLPFIKVGDQIEEDTVVCIVEAMKVMNEVKAGVAGKVAEIMIDNAQPVEYGTKILRVL